MNWLRLSLFAGIALLFSLDLSAAFAFGDEVERGDNYIDRLLKDMLEENGHEYDPYILEDSRVGFSKKIAFVNVSGEAKLHNGYITGLKSLHRPDHCTVEERDDGKLYVNADLGAGVLNFHYEGTVKFMNFGPTITVHGELAYLETHMEFTVDSKTGRKGELKKFNIDDMKGMDIKITGLGPMNWALNYLVKGITTLFKGFVNRMVEKQIRNHLAERLPKYQFPVEEGGIIEVITDPEVVTETEAPEVVTETEEPEVVTEIEETEAPEVVTETEVPEVEETEAPEVEETEAPEVEETEAPEVEETEAPEVEEAMQAMRVLNYLGF